MTVKEAADRLEVSVSLTYSLLTSGKLRGTRHGLGRGTWRVSESQLSAYLDSVESGAPPRAERPRPARLKHLKV